MLSQKYRSNQTSQAGVVVLEALIAILIFSMGILAVVGLQAAMVKSTADSKVRAEASYIAQQRIGRMWADQANLLNYVVTDEDISSQLPAGTLTVNQPTPGQFLITITWQQPGEAVHNYSTTATITGGV